MAGDYSGNAAGTVERVKLGPYSVGPMRPFVPRGALKMTLAFGVGLVVLPLTSGASPRRGLLPSDLPLATAGPDSFRAEFRTTKGAFTVKAHRDWAPLGADRLYHLVRGGYFDGLTIYRVG